MVTPVATAYLRPTSLEQAQTLLRQPGARVLAGGQSLLPTLRMGLANPALLVDLQALPALREVRWLDDSAGNKCLRIGAMATHAGVASSPRVRDFAPGLAQLAAGIADAQVRSMGTLGGSVAHHDPAACWPAGVLAAGATLCTDRRHIAADAFFTGLYATALQPGEMLLAVEFPALTDFAYCKHEQPASRFALVGVAVARTRSGVRVAVTGLGHGVQRWHAAEDALARHWSVQALEALPDAALPTGTADLHASAEYRAHLVRVLTRRCVRQCTGEPEAVFAPLTTALADTVGTPQQPEPSESEAGRAGEEGVFRGHCLLKAPVQAVWDALLDADVLRQALPGCETLTRSADHHYTGLLRVGLGPLSLHVQANVRLDALQPPHALQMQLQGEAGAMGGGEGQAWVQLQAQDAGTLLRWRVRVQPRGRLAQWGSRLMQASVQTLSDTFFSRLQQALLAQAGGAPDAAAPAVPLPWWRRLWQQLRRRMGFF